jgi:hypothetical protein
VALAIHELYSKRQKKLRGEVPDVYTYDQIPEPLRVQVIHILHDTLGDANGGSAFVSRLANETYGYIVETLRHEYGIENLPHLEKPYNFLTYMEELSGFLKYEPDTERVLDAIELSFEVIDGYVLKNDTLIQ